MQCGPHFMPSTVSFHFICRKTELQLEEEAGEPGLLCNPLGLQSPLLRGLDSGQRLRKRVGSWTGLFPAGLGALARAEPTSVGKGVRFSCSPAPSWPLPREAYTNKNHD